MVQSTCRPLTGVSRILTHFLLLLVPFLGKFQAYWKYVHRITKEQRHTLETLPNKAQFDPNWQQKRLKGAYEPKNWFNLFSDDEHYVWATLENVMYEWNTCGLRGRLQDWCY